MIATKDAMVGKRARASLRGGPVLVALVLILGAAAGIVCVRNAGAQDAIRDRQQELTRLKAEIEDNRARIGELRRKEDDLNKLAASLEKDRELTHRYIQELEDQERALRQDIADRQSALVDKEIEVGETVGRLKTRLRRYYKLRHVSGGELLFSSRSFNELFARTQFMARLIQRDRLDLGALAQERSEISRVTVVLDSRRRAIETLQREKRSEESRLQDRGRRTQAALEDVQGERAEYEARVREQEASRAAIRSMISRLEKERERSAKAGAEPTFRGTLEDRRGKLDWPVEGKVLAEFGVEVHPKYHTRVPINGIIIGAPEGTPVRATAPGVVEFVDWYPGYGRTVVLNHGSGYYTLYAHASSILVQRGNTVEAGQEIARVGDTDSLRGPCLHFEVRKGTDALDPRDWLR